MSDLWIRISILGGVQQNLGSSLLSALLPVPVPVPLTSAGPVTAAVAHRVTSNPDARAHVHAQTQTNGQNRWAGTFLRGVIQHEPTHLGVLVIPVFNSERGQKTRTRSVDELTHEELTISKLPLTSRAAGSRDSTRACARGGNKSTPLPPFVGQKTGTAPPVGSILLG